MRAHQLREASWFCTCLIIRVIRVIRGPILNFGCPLSPPRPLTSGQTTITFPLNHNHLSPEPQSPFPRTTIEVHPNHNCLSSELQLKFTPTTIAFAPNYN